MAESILAQIVHRKRSDIAARLVGASLDPAPTHRSLRSALAQAGARFIMEVKKQSPSGHRSMISVADAVEAYAPVADAISVLTDGPFFGGSLEDLPTVRAGFDGPILAKDFVIDRRQVSEARAYGADAVLVILTALTDEQAAGIMAEARRLSMDVIVEIHDEQELGRALALGAEIIGINNRDLKTLETDLSVTERLANMVPDYVVLISESGIGSRRHVERLSTRVDAFLVGSSLMAANDVAQAARSLVFGPVKICGLTNIGDVESVAACGASHAGFIFTGQSPRQVDGTVEALTLKARRRGLQTVGVFGSKSVTEIAGLAHDLELQAVQLHGEQKLRELRSKLSDRCEIWVVSGVGDTVEPPRRGADRTLFDTRSNGRTGGTGRAFDWSLLAGHPDLTNAFIAGGIGPTNARSAQNVGAFGIDLCSGVEVAPGRKDKLKLKALFEALRPVSRGDRSC